jgi:hypothetical protein
MSRESQDNSAEQDTAGNTLPPVEHIGDPMQPDAGCSCPFPCASGTATSGSKDEWAHMMEELRASTSRLRAMVERAQALRTAMTRGRKRPWIVPAAASDTRHW